MPAELLKTLFLPLALIVIMFGMGMTLTLLDFKRVIWSPQAKLLGLFNQLILLPAIALGMVFLFGLSGELAIGLMLVAACPGGPTSNMITHLAKGDTALSVTLTAVVSVITVFTIPLIVGLAMRYFGTDQEAIVHLPFGRTVLQLMIVTVFPISGGMWLKARWPGCAARMERPVNLASIFFLAAVILAAVLQEEDLGGQFAEVGFAVVTLNLATMAMGYFVAVCGKLSLRQRISIVIESGIQNGTLALAIALGILNSPRIAVPAVVYSLVMFASGAAMILRYGRRSGIM